MYAEARGEDDTGKRAVAHVVLNRSRQLNKSVCSVAKEQGQFVQANPARDFKLPTLGKDPTGGATHFQRRNQPTWLGLRKYTRLGKHTFYGK